MSIDLTSQIVSTSLDDTMRLAEAIGTRLKGGEIIELVSDLGGGKTAFVRGLAKGMGSSDRVASPSFTISREYVSGDKTLYHFDFYRLHDAGLIANELAEVMGDLHSVVAVEWADIVADVLPGQRLSINIRSTGDTEREFHFSYPRALQYLISENA